MTWRELIALVLESTIGAELILFAVFLLSSARRPPALYLLAGLTSCLALMMAANLLIGALGWFWLGDVVLFLDLLVPPAVYLYVRQLHYPARQLRVFDLFHATPAILGTLAWTSGVLPSMDVYVNVCWFGYLAFAGYFIVRHYQGYAPVARQRFLITLMMMLFVAGSLRLVIVLQATGETSFREGLPYLFVLGILFLLTCQILLTALRCPDLLSVPGSHVKYMVSSLDGVDLDALERRLAQVLAEQRPYLDPDFTLAGLGALLDTPARHVSQLINARHEMNFSAYMNFWRARTAVTLLVQNPAKPIKIVMHEAGFRSKSIFNREFQRHFACSPANIATPKQAPHTTRPRATFARFDIVAGSSAAKRGSRSQG